MEKNKKAEMILVALLCIMLILVAGLLFYIANGNSLVIKGNNKQAVVEEIKTETNTTPKTSFVKFNVNNIQGREDMEFNLSSKSLAGVNVSLNNGEVFVSFSYLEDLIEINNINIKINEEYKVEGLNKKAVDVYIFTQGEGSTIPKVLILLEDGTVEYLSITKGCETKIFKSQGKLGDYKDVVRFTEVGVGPKEEGPEGYRTAVVIQADGKIFEVPQIIG